MPRFGSLVEMLETRARQQPEVLAARFLVDGEDEEVSWSYAQLDARARAVAGALWSQVEPGARALLLFPPGLDYLSAFFGCLYAGVIAVPAYPPDPSRLHRTLPRLKAIIADCDASIALSTEAIVGMASAIGEAIEVPGRPLKWLATDTATESSAKSVAAGADDVAFLQYTSGSTATPRGVIVTHGNLLHNLDAIAAAGGTPPDAHSVTWLPPYHDMGLIGGILSPVYQGFPMTLMSPLHFLQRPWRWLAALSKYRGTHSAGPSFAYELCVKKTTAQQRAALDLSRWHVSYNGAEPIAAAGLQRFAEAFAPSGFRLETFLPCYGLAEGTLISSGGRAQQPPVIRRFLRGSVERGRAELAEGDDSIALVGCGPSIDGQRIAIANPQTRAVCADGEVGEIWLSGGSVARGYWNRPEETQQTFGATLQNGDGPFLRTGDLGFLLEGELFVTGRIKDLLIIAGENHYPQDLERSAEASHPALRPGASAAFSVSVGDEERAVIVFEVEGGPDAPAQAEIGRAIRAAVSREHQLSLHAVVLVPRNAVPRTSSGKVQRHLCRQQFLDGEPAPL